MNFRRFILTPHGRGRGPPGYHLSALKASRCRIANSRLNEGCCCEGFSDAWMTTASPTHRQQASEKRQGTKSRGLGTRRCSSDYGDYMSGPLSRGQRAIPLTSFFLFLCRGIHSFVRSEGYHSFARPWRLPERGAQDLSRTGGGSTRPEGLSLIDRAPR